MIYYIDGEEVNQRIAKDYFFAGHARTQKWMDDHHGPKLDCPTAIWDDRDRLTTQDQIFNISAIQELGGLEMCNE